MDFLGRVYNKINLNCYVNLQNIFKFLKNILQNQEKKYCHKIFFYISPSKIKKLIVLVVGCKNMNGSEIQFFVSNFNSFKVKNQIFTY